MKEITFFLRIENGLADEGKIDIHDAGETITGAARVTNLINHSFANDNVFRSKNHSADGSKTFVHSSLKGCFEEKIEVVFDERVVETIGSSVIADHYFDYFQCALSAAVGEEPTPTGSFVKKILRNEKTEALFEEMATCIEAPLIEMLKTIAREDNVVVSIHRPRVGEIFKFDSNSYDFLKQTIEEDQHTYIVGNVTKFGYLNGYGRLYSDKEQRIISFRLVHKDEQRYSDLALKSMSLGKKQKQGQKAFDFEKGKMNFKVTRALSANGRVKYYLVHDILEINPNP